MIQDYRSDLLSGRSGRGPQMPLLGFLRSGIMRLVRPKKDTKTGEVSQAEQTAYDKRVVIYTRMVEEGKGWDDIGKAIGGKNYLTPENRDYFTCRAVDCKTNQENAEILHKLYADSDGKIRRVPIIFLSNDWIDVIPHSLAYWKQSEWVYRSEYIRVTDPDSGEAGWQRICVKPVPYKQGVRPFGGQETEMRCVCNPDACKEYQADLCKLSGYVEGMIPGTKGFGVWRIHSKSIHSFRQIMSMLVSLEKACGRIYRLIDEGSEKSLLYIRKAGDQEVNHYDYKKGEKKTVDQDLIYLETEIDMFKLMLDYQPKKILARGEQAKALVAGNTSGNDGEGKVYNINQQKRAYPQKEEHISTGDEEQGKALEPEQAAQATEESEREKEIAEAEKRIKEKSELIGGILTNWVKLKGPIQKDLKKEFPGQVADFDLETLKKFKAAIGKKVTEGGE